MESKRKSGWIRALKYGVGLALLALLVYLADVRSLIDVISLVTFSDLIILSVISFLLIAVSVLKWRLFLRRLHIEAGFWKLFGLYLVGYFVNLVMPSYVGGDVVRSLFIGKGTDRSHAVTATFLERYTGIVAMVVMALAAVLWAPGVTTEIVWATLFVAVALLAASIFAFTGSSSAVLRRLKASGKILSICEKVESALIHGTSDKRLLSKAFALSLLFHLLTVVNTLAVAYAVGWDSAAWRDLLVVVPLILLVGAVPISPQGLGIQEGAFVFFLTGVGATPAQALAMALILRAKSYILAAIGAFVWMGRKGEMPQPTNGSSALAG